MIFLEDGFKGALPAEERETSKASILRDKMLKHGPDLSVITPDQKIDTDLDGK